MRCAEPQDFSQARDGARQALEVDRRIGQVHGVHPTDVGGAQEKKESRRGQERDQGLRARGGGPPQSGCGGCRGDRAADDRQQRTFGLDRDERSDDPRQGRSPSPAGRRCEKRRRYAGDKSRLGHVGVAPRRRSRRDHRGETEKRGRGKGQRPRGHAAGRTPRRHHHAAVEDEEYRLHQSKSNPPRSTLRSACTGGPAGGRPGLG